MPLVVDLARLELEERDVDRPEQVVGLDPVVVPHLPVEL